MMALWNCLGNLASFFLWSHEEKSHEAGVTYRQEKVGGSETTTSLYTKELRKSSRGPRRPSSHSFFILGLESEIVKSKLKFGSFCRS